MLHVLSRMELWAAARSWYLPGVSVSYYFPFGTAFMANIGAK